MQHQSKLPYVTTSIFSIMSALASEHNAINLSQGFPNFESDPTLINLVTQAMQSGDNQYAPMPGRLDLREAIAHKMEQQHQSVYDPQTEITVTAGATQAIYTAIAAFIRPKDEVIIFTPAYDCYEPAIDLHGGMPIAYQLHGPNYKIDWQSVRALINAKTKMIIINTPHNPSGTIFSENDFLELQRLLKGTNIIVLSDEVYEHIIFDNLHHYSAAAFEDLKSRSFVIASFGKTFHNTGWKVGYCCAPQKLMAEFQKVHQYNVFSIHHPTQSALASYLKQPEHYLELGTFYQKKRDYFISLLEGSRFKMNASSGTYFQVLDYTLISEENAVDFAKRLTIEHGVAGIPMSVFNRDHLDEKTLRFCFAKTDKTLEQAARILRQL